MVNDKSEFCTLLRSVYTMGSFLVCCVNGCADPVSRQQQCPNKAIFDLEKSSSNCNDVNITKNALYQNFSTFFVTLHIYDFAKKSVLYKSSTIFYYITKTYN